MKARLVFALATLMAAPGIAIWGLSSPTGAAQQAAPKGTPISFPTAAASPAVVRPPVIGPGWRLVFDPRFSGSSLNTTVWATCYPWRNVATGCNNSGNAEYEWYLPSQDHVSRGVLSLIARQVPQGLTGQPKTYYCKSGMITSNPSFNFKYGYVRIVARLASGPGLWSALWLAASNQQWPPEIDLVESWGRPWVRTGVYFHPRGAKGAKTHFSPAEDAALTKGWHTFSLSWTYRHVQWFVDGRLVLAVRQHVPHQLMYLIANLADYSHPRAAGGCTGRLLVRSVKVWQR